VEDRLDVVQNKFHGGLFAATLQVHRRPNASI